jgi:hypothetical protein
MSPPRKNVRPLEVDPKRSMALFLCRTSGATLMLCLERRQRGIVRAIDAAMAFFIFDATAARAKLVTTNLGHIAIPFAA